MNKEQFIEELNKININLTEEQLIQLEKYYELLVSYNEKVNLTAITDKKEVYLKHFYDSLTLIKAINLKDNLKICDVGTGAGFPGIVLKICFPNLDITLVDSLEKRIKFLNFVIKELNLKNIVAIHSRMEELKEEEKYDVVVSRAVARTNILLELVSKLPKINSYVILMKANIEEELQASKKAIDVLNYNLEQVISFELPIEKSKRNLVILKKIAKTNSKYPRDFTQIKKRPL